jgi:hypothetical protein
MQVALISSTAASPSMDETVGTSSGSRDHGTPPAPSTPSPPTEERSKPDRPVPRTRSLPQQRGEQVGAHLRPTEPQPPGCTQNRYTTI